MQTRSVEFSCAWCGEINHTFIDPSQGEQQNYVEDCQVCCHPNILYILVSGEHYEIRSEQE
ncbi:MAG: CPXCG motif-containing cysteine-rich protein [Balneolales bacterium]